jgi:hypothetical protein
LRRIAELYAIERSIQGRTADARRHVRNTSTRPLIEMMMKTLKHVGTEIALHVLTYNMKRLMRMLGVGGLIEAIRA